MASWKKIIVSGSIPELFHISASGNIVPVTDDASNLGTANQQFKDLYIDGTAYIDSAQIDSLGAAMIKDGVSSRPPSSTSTLDPKASPASETPRTPAVF